MPKSTSNTETVPVLSRRKLMATGGGALMLASGVLAGAGAITNLTAQAQNATPVAGHEAHSNSDQQTGGVIGGPFAWEPVDLIEPDEWRSQDGTLTATLRAQYEYRDIGGYRLYLRTYEGTIPGPTLRVRPGDKIRLTLVNVLPPNPDVMPAAHNMPHHFNTTNLHLHGLHVSPSDLSDNPFRTMEPGQSYAIEVDLPSDHPSGTYWYHPHFHGSADIQVTSGMAGTIIVDGDFADVPEIAAARERVLVLNEVLFDSRGTIEQYDTVWPEAVPRFLSVNGQREPIVRLRPGEVQRWRIVHAGHEDNLRLALDGHQLHTIAFDGIQTSRVGADDSLVIAPGQRVDVLVQAGEPGSYELRAAPNDQGYPSPTGLLAHVVVEGDPLPMLLPQALPPSPLAAITNDEITGARTVTFSAHDPEAPAAANYQEFAFLVDGLQFDPNRVDQRIQLNAIEEWTIVNDHDSDHVFHIHTNPFQVTKVNGEAVDEPVWRDTVIVPRNGSVTFRSRFLDFTGKSLLHCHMLNHETLGMMQVIEFFE